jgi:aspartate aminotransferase
MPFIHCLKPQGAFYAFPNISATFGKKTAGGKPIADSVSFCEHLLAEAKVACVPGAGFGTDNYMRLS